MTVADYLKSASHLLREHHKTLNLERPLCCFASVAQLAGYTQHPKKKYWLYYWMFLSRSIARRIRQRPCTQLDIVCPEQWPIWTGNVEERGGSDKLSSHCGQAAGGQTHPSSLKSRDQCSSNRKTHIFTPLFPSFISSHLISFFSHAKPELSSHLRSWFRMAGKADTLHPL